MVAKGVEIGERGRGTVAPPSQLLGKLSPPFHCYRYSDKYVLSCTCPRVITTGASVACTATGCKLMKRLSSFGSCLYLIPCWRRERIQRWVFPQISGCGLKNIAACFAHGILHQHYYSLAPPPTKNPFYTTDGISNNNLCFLNCIFGLI